MDNELVEPHTARVPFTTVLASITGLWLCYFVLITLRSLSLELGFEDEMIWRRALVCLAGIVTMPAQTRNAAATCQMLFNFTTEFCPA